MNAVHLAEQATLGGLLIHPDPLTHISDWLRAEDFTDLWHRDVYTALREHHTARDPLWAARLGDVLIDRLGRARADLPRIHDLMAATPLDPVPVRYARMVLENAVREQTAALGVLLRAAATAGDPVALRTSLAVVVETIADNDSRWRTAHAPQQNSKPQSHSQVQGSGERVLRVVSAPAPRVGWRDTALAADRTLSAYPEVDAGLVAEREQQLIAALATHTLHIRSVAAWLRPDTLTDSTWRPVWAALIDLADHGDPIDPVTLTWHIHRASPRLGEGPRVRDLRDGIDAATTTDPRHAAGLVARDQLRRYGDHAATVLQATAANPGADVADVLETGRLMTTTLTDLAAAMSSPTSRDTPTPGTSTALGARRAEPTSPRALSVVRSPQGVTR